MHKKSILSIDLLRLSAIIGVIIIHCDNITASPTNYIGGISWWIINILHSFARLAVPTFIMISGYLLLNRNNNYSQIFKKTVNRILLPLIFWYGFYLWWGEYFHHNGQTIWQMTRSLLEGNLFHLYFFWIIGGLYLTLPIWQTLIKNVDQNKLKITIFLFFILAIVQSLIDYFIFGRTFFASIPFYFVPYTAYFLLGGYIEKFKPIYNSKKIALIFLSAGLAIAICKYLTLLLFNSGHFTLINMYHVDYWFFHFNPLIIILTTSFFLLISYLSQSQFMKAKKAENMRPLISNLANASFAVYLIHPFVLDLIDVKLLSPLSQIQSSLWLYFSQRIILVLIFSFVISIAIRKIPLIKKIVGQ